MEADIKTIIENYIKPKDNTCINCGKYKSPSNPCKYCGNTKDRFCRHCKAMCHGTICKDCKKHGRFATISRYKTKKRYNKNKGV